MNTRLHTCIHTYRFAELCLFKQQNGHCDARRTNQKQAALARYRTRVCLHSTVRIQVLMQRLCGIEPVCVCLGKRAMTTLGCMCIQLHTYLRTYTKYIYIYIYIYIYMQLNDIIYIYIYVYIYIYIYIYILRLTSELTHAIHGHHDLSKHIPCRTCHRYTHNTHSTHIGGS